jgi:hypothetical protein
MVGAWDKAASVNLRPVTCSTPAINSTCSERMALDLQEIVMQADSLDTNDVRPHRREHVARPLFIVFALPAGVTLGVAGLVFDVRRIFRRWR